MVPSVISIDGGNPLKEGILLRCYQPKPANTHPRVAELNRVPCEFIAEAFGHRVYAKERTIRIKNISLDIFQDLPIYSGQSNVYDSNAASLMIELERSAAWGAWKSLENGRFGQKCNNDSSAPWLDWLLEGSKISRAMLDFSVDHIATDSTLETEVLKSVPGAMSFLADAIANSSGDSFFPLWCGYSLSLWRFEVWDRKARDWPQSTIEVFADTIP